MRGAKTEVEAFEMLLKGSTHFNDVINSHRRATAAVHAQVLGLLVAAGHLELPKVLEILHGMDKVYATSSDGSARRLAAAMVRDELTAMARGA
jgi:hypothetical protein